MSRILEALSEQDYMPYDSTLYSHIGLQVSPPIEETCTFYETTTKRYIITPIRTESYTMYFVISGVSEYVPPKTNGNNAC